MTDRSVEPWYPTAAYLYVLHLDDLALAWEYLRRHPDYRGDWLHRHRQPETAHGWGCVCWKTRPGCARRASSLASRPPLHGATSPGHRPAPGCRRVRAVAHSRPQAPDPRWRRLMLATRWPGCCLRWRWRQTWRMAWPTSTPSARATCLAHAIARSGPNWTSWLWPPKARLRRRLGPGPPPTALQELHTLQALDATLAGASLREVAEGLFGTDAVVKGWYADGGLRSRVRRLVRRGQGLMRAGYRRLAQLQ